MSGLEQLLSMGFSKRSAQRSIEACGGNIELAASCLLDERAESEEAATKVIQAPISQYDVESGASACTCICLQAVLTILEEIDREGSWQGSPDDIMDIVMAGCSTYATLLGSRCLTSEHTSVADVLPNVSEYNRAITSMRPQETHQRLLGPVGTFLGILEEVRNAQTDRPCSVAVTITKPPEMIVAFLPRPQGQRERDLPQEESLQLNRSSGGPWLLFDSHPRPQLGLTGASVRCFRDEAQLAEALEGIFSAIDLEEGANIAASMYNMVDCSPLVLNRQPKLDDSTAASSPIL